MNHHQASRLLADFEQGRLDAPLAAEVEQHVAACPDCQEWLETYALLGAALGAQPAHSHPAPEELAACIESKETAPEASEHLPGCAECRRDLQLVIAAIGEARHEWQKEEAVSRRLRAKSRTAALARVAASLVFAVLLVPFLFAPGAQVEHDQLITGGALVGEETFVGHSIHASDVRIESGSSIVLEAKESVTFGEGFEVTSGASLTVSKAEKTGA